LRTRSPLIPNHRRTYVTIIVGKKTASKNNINAGSEPSGNHFSARIAVRDLDDIMHRLISNPPQKISTALNSKQTIENPLSGLSFKNPIVMKTPRPPTIIPAISQATRINKSSRAN
jgi:hypothetical protein